MQSKVVSLFILLLSHNLVLSQNSKSLPALAKSTNATIESAIENEEVTGVVASIVSSDSIWMVRGYGYHSVFKEQAIDPQRSLFQVGSVGKVFTALLAIQYIDSGLIDENVPIKHYLDERVGSRLDQEQITMNHLLTHSAGLNDRIIGYAARKQEDRVPLSKHLEESMPGSYIKPGVEVSYSNYSYALAGYLVERLVDINFSDLVKKEILGPLNMNSSGYSIQELNSTNLVQGYSYDSKNKRLNPSEILFPNPVPAGSLVTTAKDMSKFQQYLLRNHSSLEKMFNHGFDPNPDLAGYSYGFETWQTEGVEIFAKGGMVPGFTSLLIVIPGLDISIFLSTNSSSDHLIDDIAMSYWEILFGDYYQRPLANVNQFQKNDPKLFTGSYRLNRLNRESIAEFFGQIRNTINVWNNGDTLKLYHDNETHRYLETEPYTFTNVNNENQKIVFHLEDNGTIKGLSRDNRIAGSYVASRYEKVPWYDSNDFLNEWFGLFVLGTVSFLFYPLIWLFRIIVKRLKGIKKKTFSYSGFIAFLFSLIVFIWISNYFVFLLKHGNELVFGFPENLKFYLNLPILMILLLILGIVNTVTSLKAGSMNKTTLSIYSLHYVTAIVFLMVLYRWHFIGVHI